MKYMLIFMLFFTAGKCLAQPCPAQPLNYPCDTSGNPTYTNYDECMLDIQQDSINAILRRILKLPALRQTACPAQPLAYPCDAFGNPTYTDYNLANVWIQQDTTIALLRKLLSGGGGGGGNIVDSIQKYAWLLNGNSLVSGTPPYIGWNTATDFLIKINSAGFGFMVNGTSNGNMALGVQAGNKYYTNLLTGTGNTMIGRASCNQATSSFNTLVGYTSGANITNGGNNTGIGEGVMQGVQNGAKFDYAIGFQPMGNTLKMGTASYNGGIGNQALFNINNGNLNVGVGDSALFNTTDGNRNLGIGNLSGLANTTGTNNTFIGHYCNVSSNALTNVILLGYGSFGSASNTGVIGNKSTVSINIHGGLSDSTGKPAIVLGAGAGSGGSPSSSDTGTNLSGTIVITTGTTTVAGIICTVTLANSLSFPNGMAVNLQPVNNNAQIYVGAIGITSSRTQFNLNTTAATPLTGAGTVYVWKYIVAGY